MSFRRKLLYRLLLVASAVVLTDCLSFFALSAFWDDHFFESEVTELLDRLKPVQDFLDPAEPPADDQLAVGIFGGSVADAFGDHLQHTVSAHGVARDWEARTGRQVIIRSLGHDGMAQPGQLNMLHLHAQSIDVAIFLDGFNEAMEWELPGCAGAARFWQGYEGDPGQVFAPLRESLEPLRAMADQSLYGVFQFSALFRIYLRHVDHTRRNRVLDYMTGVGLDTVDAARPAHGPDSVAPVWADCVNRSAEYAERLGVRAFFFLQPNQHVSGSKPLSVQELALIDEGEYCDPEERARFSTVDGVYGDMREAIGELRADGIRVTALSWLFREVTHTVYRAGCCHCNDRGNDRMAAAILDVVLSNLD